MESYAEAGMSAQQLIGIFDLIFSGHNNLTASDPSVDFRDELKYVFAVQLGIA